MKKLINRPDAVVPEMIEGLVAAYPGLRVVPGYSVIVRADIPTKPDERAVAVISGGGSGHEPAHAGYVGHGMLSAAIAGDVFTSPSPDSVLAAIRASAGLRGAVLVVKNYTGDRLNFGLAAELARAEGIPVEVVIVADDVALVGKEGTPGRRGLAGTIFVHKVAGHAAESGENLATVAAVARSVADAVRTMGVALTPCTVPAAGRPGFTLGDQEIELGLGIHGEPGIRRGPLESADVLVDRMLDAILGDLGSAAKSPVVLMVNNLGGTPTMELAIVARRAIAELERRGLAVERAYLGTFLSALEMAGVSLTVLPADAVRLAALDAATDAPAWPNAAGRGRNRVAPPIAEPHPVPTHREPPQTPIGQKIEAGLRAVIAAVRTAAPRLTELDQAVGDGDLGISLERGVTAIEAELATYPLDDPGATLHAIAVTLQRALGGSSGPFYAVFLLRAAAELRGGPADNGTIWATAFRSGCTGIAELGGASVGDRTMLDALVPAADVLALSITQNLGFAKSLRAVADAARKGTAQTTQMPPRKGRSSYLGDRVLGHPDPGAEAVAVWLDALATALGTEPNGSNG